jgi:uncharacterized protein
MKVPRLGARAFEQCAGFLRIKDGEDPLDASAVHPEAYGVVATMAAAMGVEVKALIGNDELIKQLDARKFITADTGEHTVKDIITELKKPGLDPRSELQQFEFANIYSIEDVKEGMIVPGSVTNITRFGAFVDIGVKQDGLVHISEITHKYIADPNEALKLNQKVMVLVTGVDMARKRIALSIKQAQEPPARKEKAAQQPRKDFKQKPKEEPLSMNDALSKLRNKFGR